MPMRSENVEVNETHWPATVMRIGIDARELLERATGVGRYLENLCRAWAQSARTRNHQFTLYIPAQPESGRQLLPFLKSRDERFEVRLVSGSLGTWWEQVTLPSIVNQAKLDVFFSPAYGAPLRIRAPVVVTIPDVSFAAHPEWFRWREGLRRRWLAARATQCAARILTISEFSKREIVNWFGVNPDHIDVTPLAVDDRLSCPNARVTREPLILFIGSIFTRRHLPWLISAFARAVEREPEARLAIIGSNRSHPVEDLWHLSDLAGVRTRVTIEDWVDDTRLATYYGRARAFAFLSEYEGFGLPPLEALAAGIPIIVLDTPVAREVYGDAATYVAAGNITSIADALVQALSARPTQSPAVLKRYSWARTADVTLDALERATGSNPP
tara:strand:- start:1066 stop:2223 length:1158 start_codon:yes stop_codon:yes gene_type:complete